MRSIITLFIFLTVLFSPGLLQAQDPREYYVDIKATTNGNGTIDSPWNDLSSAIYGWGAFDTTDVIVYMRGGVYPLTAADPLYIGANRSGNNGHYFILKAYTGETPVIDGSAKTADFSSIVSIVDVEYIKLDGLTFANLKELSGFGIYIAGKSRHLEIKNCKFDSLYWLADPVEAKYPGPADYIYPIRIDGTDPLVSITDVLISGNHYSNIALGNGNLVGIAGNTGTITQTGNTETAVIRPQPRTEFYVATTGSDVTGNGSRANPWQTISAAINRAGYDFSTPTPTLLDSNLTIFLRAGTFAPPQSIYIGPNRGPNGKWFTLKNYNNEYVVIDGGNLTQKYASIFAIDSAKYIRIEGLNIQNLENDSTLTQNGLKDVRYGIAVLGACSNIHIKNNDIYDLKWTRDTTKAKTPGPSDVLSAITILGTSNTPMKNIVIEGNTVHDIVPGYAEAIAINGNVDSFTIINNEVYDIANIAIVSAGNYKWVLQNYPNLLPANNQSRNGLIKDNTTYRCLSPVAISAGIYLDGSKNITVQGNTSYNNGVGISVGNEQDSSTGSGHLVHSNVLYNNLGAGIYIGSNNPSSRVENSVIKWNTIEHNYHIDTVLYRRTQGMYGTLSPAGRWAEIVVNRAQGITFKENEVTSSSDIMTAFVFGQTGLTFQDNEYHTLSNNPCNVYFVKDTTNDGIPDVFYSSFHRYAQATGLDHTSTLAGVAYDVNGCGTVHGAERTTTLELEKIPAKNLVSTFPNPATDRLTVRIQQEKAGAVQLQLWDISGKLVLSQQRQLPAGTQFMGWSNLKQQRVAPGVYLLQVNAFGKKEVIKVMIR